MMSINAVKARRDRRRLRGRQPHRHRERRRDARRQRRARTFLSNNAGGILGGISNGDPVVVRFAVKPTSSILTPRRTVTTANEDTEVSTKGRHDPCVGIRAVPIGEAMMAVVLADHFLRHRGQTGRDARDRLLATDGSGAETRRRRCRRRRGAAGRTTGRPSENLTRVQRIIPNNVARVLSDP